MVWPVLHVYPRTSCHRQGVVDGLAEWHAPGRRGCAARGFRYGFGSYLGTLQAFRGVGPNDSHGWQWDLLARSAVRDATKSRLTFRPPVALAGKTLRHNSLHLQRSQLCLTINSSPSSKPPAFSPNATASTAH